MSNTIISLALANRIMGTLEQCHPAQAHELQAEITKASLHGEFVHKLEDGSPDKTPDVNEELVFFLAAASEFANWLLTESGIQDMRVTAQAREMLDMGKRLGEEHRTMYIPYATMVDNLFKKMNTPAEAMMHAAIGVAGEGGELLDACKKHWVYNKPLDVANVLEELGDGYFYAQAMINMLGLTWADVRMANRLKLAKRYPEGVYSDAAAQARADKQE